MADDKILSKVDQKFLSELESLEEEANSAFSMPAQEYEVKKSAMLRKRDSGIPESFLDDLPPRLDS